MREAFIGVQFLFAFCFECNFITMGKFQVMYLCYKIISYNVKDIVIDSHLKVKCLTKIIPKYS